MTKNVCGIIRSETRSGEEAKKHAEAMKNCPNLILIGITSNIVHAVYIVPEYKRWWLKIPETNPEEIGVEKASVHIVEDLTYPAKFTKKPIKKTEIAPCGADCQTCHLREKYKCNGCPATIHYKRALSIY